LAKVCHGNFRWMRFTRRTTSARKLKCVGCICPYEALLTALASLGDGVGSSRSQTAISGSRTLPSCSMIRWRVFGGSEVHYEPLRGAAVLPSLPAALFVFDPVLILLAVGHGGAFEGRGVS
jgi:hypothetical protein